MKVKLTDFEKYRPDLLKLAHNMTRFKSGITYQYDYDLSQDIVQDCYIRFHKIVQSNKILFETEGHLKQILLKNIWRISMTSKKNNKGVKYKSKENKVLLNLLPYRLHPYCLSNSISKQELDNIYVAIHSLKSKNDIDILLLCIEGFNCDEISNKLFKTKRAIASSLCRSRELLRKKLHIDKYFCSTNRKKQ